MKTRPVNRRRKARFPNEPKLAVLYDECRAKPNVRGCFIGRKKVGGRRTRSLALVCVVGEKVSRRKLGAEERIPHNVEWRDGDNFSARIPTDVQIIEDCESTSFIPGPGDRFDLAPGLATAGVSLHHPIHGSVLSTAAHAFLANHSQAAFPADAPTVSLQNADGGPTLSVRPKFATWTTSADYALVEVIGKTPTNLYEDKYLVSGPHWAMPSDVGKGLLALTPRGPLPMVFEGAKASLFIGNYLTEFMLLARPVVPANGPRSGDSGCCLVDEEFRLWGLLSGICVIGGMPMSVFQSPHWLLSNGAKLL